MKEVKLTLKKIEELKRQVVYYSKKMVRNDLTTGTSGNISVMDRKQNLIAITPSGMDYELLEPIDIPIIDTRGNVVEGDRKPSSEQLLHLEVYKKRNDVNAVIHTHSSFATTLATINQPIPVLLAEVAAMAGGEITVAPYTIFGTQEFAQVSVDALGNKPAVLLQNHGVLSVGENLHKTMVTAMDVEEAAKIFLYTKMANEKPTFIPKEDIQVLYTNYQQNYGQ